MQKAEKRLGSILRKFKSSNIPDKQIASLDVINALPVETRKLSVPIRRLHIGLLCLSIFSLLLIKHINLNKSSECVIDMPIESASFFRQPEECNICEGLSSVDRITNISDVEFYKSYASTNRPVIVTDGAKNWLAMKYFNFDFFKNLYQSVSEANNGEVRFNCQFFPYKTEFATLEEALNMNEKRARLEFGQKPWYIGWSNCNDEAGEVLRQYYEKPYFLPNTSENLALNWIFMGGPGHGAHMHVDNVGYPSWQAQISGRKTWSLAPPAECIYKCKNIQVTVEPGEIIVIDSNKWYHQTDILPGQISITIGSEFD